MKQQSANHQIVSNEVASGRDYIGTYRLLRMVRAGKTAKIWEAMNPTDNKRIALKALHGDACKNRDEIAALKHEYNVGKSVETPSIIKIYDYEVVRGIPFIVMEFFDAPNIKQALRTSPERITDNLTEVVHQAVDGLDKLHEQSWIHRDVKPDNFLIDEHGMLKLIDFSIAQKMKRGFGKLLGGKSKVQGTMSYMAPEQIRGENTDVQADIYSLGCTFFELVAGRVPYTGTSANDLLNKHLKASVPSAAAFNENVTSEFAKLITQMMAKRADQRPQSMADIQKTLEKMRIVRVRRPSN